MKGFIGIAAIAALVLLLGGGHGSRHGSSGSHHGGAHREASVGVGGFRRHMHEKLGRPHEPEQVEPPEASDGPEGP